MEDSGISRESAGHRKVKAKAKVKKEKVNAREKQERAKATVGEGKVLERRG